jgi:hypothetical protein
MKMPVEDSLSKMTERAISQATKELKDALDELEDKLGQEMAEKVALKRKLAEAEAEVAILKNSKGEDMTAREFLTQYNNAKGYGVSYGELEETLTEGKTVWVGGGKEHRWYIIRPTVKDIDGTFILFDDYVITGDDSMSDMGLEYDLDYAKVVERKERIETVIYYE